MSTYSILKKTILVNDGVTVNKYSLEKKRPPSDYLPRNNYSSITYFLVNKYSLHVISTPLEIVWSVVYSHLNTSGSSIFLGNTYSIVKPLY